LDDSQAADADPSAFFFPILPYGYTTHIDLNGWVLPPSSSSSSSGGLLVNTVFDHEVGCEVLEILAPLALHGKQATHKRKDSGGAGLVRTHDSIGRNSALLHTGRGTHALVDAVRVQGSTGGANAVDTTVSQRLRGPDFAAAAARQPAVDFNAGMIPVAPPTRRAGKADNPAPSDPLLHDLASGAPALSFPHDSQFIGCALPVLNMHVKNLQRYFSFEVEVEDTQGRLFVLALSNAQSALVRLRLDGASLPLTLRDGWNKLTIDLAALTHTCFSATFAQVHRVRLHASAWVRRIFFSADAFPDFALPPSLRVFSDEVYNAKRAEDEQKAQARATAKLQGQAEQQQQSPQQNGGPR
jgi:hypothetical protein